MLSNYYSHAITKFYKDIYTNIINYNDNYIKTLKRGNEKHGIPAMTKQVERDGFVASAHDICSYSTGNSMRNFSYQAVIEFDRFLDFEKIQKAVRLSFDSIPILGCRLVKADRLYWKGMEQDGVFSSCALEESNNAEAAVVSFLQNTADIEKDLNIKVKVIRSQAGDTLCFKINPSCLDGTGVKAYIKLVSDIYSRIDKEKENINNNLVADMDDGYNLLKKLTLKCPGLRWNPVLDTQRSKWPFYWQQKGNDIADFIVYRISKESSEKIKGYGQARGIKVSDLVLTAYYRALFRISKPPYGVAMDITSTIDLRQFLPEYEPQEIRNLTGGFITSIPRKANESFAGTLSRVVNISKKANTDNSETLDKKYIIPDQWSSFTYFFDYFKSVSVKKNKDDNKVRNIGCTPALMDLGHISDDLILFGDNVATDAYIIPPVVNVPGLLILLSSYNGIMTMSAGYCRSSVSLREMSGFLNSIKNELVRGCES